jgi:hypothetical protein
MHRKSGKFLAATAAICVLGLALVAAGSDVDDQLMARRRVFPTVGPGLRALRHGKDGKYYLLASPAVGIAVFDSHEKQLNVIGAPPSSNATDKAGRAAIASG